LPGRTRHLLEDAIVLAVRQRSFTTVVSDSYLVEIALRMALGATTGRVVRLVLNQTIRVASTGMVVGTALAFAVSQVLRATLLFINPFDSLAYAGGLILVSLAALGAAWLPARRSARIEPTTALRFN
jgi:ABC-type antimicrobial peptide transport system permease subunit